MSHLGPVLEFSFYDIVNSASDLISFPTFLTAPVFNTLHIILLFLLMKLYALISMNSSSLLPLQLSLYNTCCFYVESKGLCT